MDSPSVRTPLLGACYYPALLAFPAPPPQQTPLPFGATAAIKKPSFTIDSILSSSATRPWAVAPCCPCTPVSALGGATRMRCLAGTTRRSGQIHGASSSGRTGKVKRLRTIFTTSQLERLEREFARQQYMVGNERYFLASSLRLTEAQVKVWFQNRRIKWRKQSFEQQQARLVRLGLAPQQMEKGHPGGKEGVGKCSTHLSKPTRPSLTSIPVERVLRRKKLNGEESMCLTGSARCRYWEVPEGHCGECHKSGTPNNGGEVGVRRMELWFT
uniref:Notochord homeobox n=1 Tax=Eptatretus burgeri TaxID=7764 RepID=A0A8C4N8K8_EPTBU